MKPVTVDIFKKVMSLIEHNDKNEILLSAKAMELNRTPEIAAQVYVAYLKLTGRDFPEVKKTKYSVSIDDNSPYFVFYRVASCCGIGVSQIRDLYNNTLLPEIVITKINDSAHYEESDGQRGNDNDLPEAIADLSKIKGIQCFKVKNNGVHMFSSDAKALKKQGAVISVYKVIYKGKISFINVIEHKGVISYDINSFHCKDKNSLIREFMTRNKNIPGGQRIS
jgi:hypothetical protein